MAYGRMGRGRNLQKIARVTRHDDDSGGAKHKYICYFKQQRAERGEKVSFYAVSLKWIIQIRTDTGNDFEYCRGPLSDVANWFDPILIRFISSRYNVHAHTDNFIQQMYAHQADWLHQGYTVSMNDLLCWHHRWDIRKGS